MLIPAKILKGLARIASKDATRSQLMGVHVSRNDKTAACATDGKVLAVSTWKEDPWEEFPCRQDFRAGPQGEMYAVTIPLGAVKGIIQGMTQKPLKPILGNVALEESSVEFRTLTTDLETERIQTHRAVEGMYPEYEKVVCADKPEMEIRLHLSRVRQMCDALMDIHGKDAFGVFQVFAENRPIQIQAKGGGVSTIGLIMPCLVPES